MEEKRIGRQEPTVRFTLPYEGTKGNEAIDLYQRSGRTAFEWQKALIYDMMAFESDEWVHSRFGFSVPRQNGKNECISIREVWGLLNGERILHTAHRTATSRSAWERLFTILESAGIHEVKGEVTEGYKSGKSKGQEWIEMSESYGSGKCAFRTRSTTGGLGESYDLLVIDEAQEYLPDQESALKYTIAASSNPQTVYLGTPPTLYSSGTLFPQFRKDVLTGAKKHAGWAEWSIDQETAVNDVDAWYQTNPSLGLKLSLRTIEDEISDCQEGKTDFNIQRMGLWISYNQKSAISRTEWDSLSVEKIPKLHGKMCIGVKFSKDGASASLSIAVRSDAGIFVECIGNHSMRDGVTWLVDFIKETKQSCCKVVADGANGLELLTSALKEEKIKAPYAVSVKDTIDANALWEQGIFGKTIVHMEQPAVTQIVSNCEKRPIGSSGGFGYKSTNIAYDISIMDSLLLSVWGLEEFGKERRKQKISY